MKHVKVLSICLIVVGLVCPGCGPSSTAQLEENKVLVRRAIEELEKANWAAFVELHTADLVRHTPDSPEPQTREELVQFFRMMNVAFPDGRRTIEDIVAEGDKVVVRLTFRGTNTGDAPGRPATGKEITVSVIIIFRIADGKIAEEWEEFDVMSSMQQLGVIPADE